MLIPTFFVLTPSVIALGIYMLLYYSKDPENRVTDPRFMLALACFAVIAGYLFVIVEQYDPTIPSMIACAASVILLAVAVVMTWTRLQPMRGTRW